MDFAYLEGFAAGDAQVIGEVLDLFRQQAALWAGRLEQPETWRDTVHTIKGAARGVGAFRLGEVCERVELDETLGLEPVREALATALAEIEAYSATRPA